MSRYRRFVCWMRFNPPYSNTWQGWREFNLKFRKEAPARYFFSKTVRGWFSYISGKFYNLKWWFLHRTMHRYHVIKTDLNPGYYDLDTRMLHSMMSLLSQYVEVTCAYDYLAYDSDRRKIDFKTKLLAYYTPFYKWKDPKRGIKWLRKVPVSGPYQAHVAKEALEIYLWWTREYPLYQLLHVEYTPLSINSDLWFEASDDAEIEAEFLQHQAGIQSALSQERKVLEVEYQRRTELMLRRLLDIRTDLWS